MRNSVNEVLHSGKSTKTAVKDEDKTRSPEMINSLLQEVETKDVNLVPKNVKIALEQNKELLRKLKVILL